jgi:hypothetical protein
MTLVWAVMGVAVLLVAGFVLARYAAWHRPRYMYSAAWAEEHWREQHERAKAHQHSDG